MNSNRYKIAILLLISCILFVLWVESEQRFVVRGRVVDASTGKPIEGASVSIKWSGTHMIEAFIPYASGSYIIEESKATTDKDGYFKIPKYFGKESYMGVYKNGYICWSSNYIFMKDGKGEKRYFFIVRNGMTVKLEPFTIEYPKFDHASFIIAVSGASGGLEGTDDERKFFYDIYWDRK